MCRLREINDRLSVWIHLANELVSKAPATHAWCGMFVALSTRNCMIARVLLLLVSAPALCTFDTKVIGFIQDQIERIL